MRMFTDNSFRHKQKMILSFSEIIWISIQVTKLDDLSGYFDKMPDFAATNTQVIEKIQNYLKQFGNIKDAHTAFLLSTKYNFVWLALVGIKGDLLPLEGGQGYKGGGK